MIDSKNNNKVTNLGYATHVAAENDKLYCVDSRVDYSSWPEVAAVNTFYTYDVKAGTKSSGSFLKNAPEELGTAVVYMIAVNDSNGDIYIGTTGHSDVNGDIYRFKMTVHIWKNLIVAGKTRILLYSLINSGNEKACIISLVFSSFTSFFLRGKK